MPKDPLLKAGGLFNDLADELSRLVSNEKAESGYVSTPKLEQLREAQRLLLAAWSEFNKAG